MVPIIKEGKGKELQRSPALWFSVEFEPWCNFSCFVITKFSVSSFPNLASFHPLHSLPPWCRQSHFKREFPEGPKRQWACVWDKASFGNLVRRFSTEQLIEQLSCTDMVHLKLGEHRQGTHGHKSGQSHSPNACLQCVGRLVSFEFSSLEVARIILV